MALPIIAIGKGHTDTPSNSQKTRNDSSTKKCMLKKIYGLTIGSSSSTPKASSLASYLSKDMIVFDKIEYNTCENMKKTKENISVYEVSKLKQQQELFLSALNVVLTSSLHQMLLQLRF